MWRNDINTGREVALEKCPRIARPKKPESLEKRKNILGHFRQRCFCKRGKTMDLFLCTCLNVKIHTGACIFKDFSAMSGLRAFQRDPNHAGNLAFAHPKEKC